MSQPQSQEETSLKDTQNVQKSEFFKKFVKKIIFFYL